MRKGSSKKVKADANAATIKLFTDLLQHFSPPDSLDSHPVRELCNITFWCGAGFGKSWDSAYPTGAQLFSGALPAMRYDRLEALTASLGGRHDYSEMSIERVKDMVYALDMFAEYASIRPRYLDADWVEGCKGELAAWVQDSFESLASLGYWDRRTQKFPRPARRERGQHEILAFFRHLADLQTGARGIAEGVRSHFITTNYDFVIETILDNIVDLDDSYELYTYRGFTPVSVNGSVGLKDTHRHHHAQQLIKLNGGFELIQTPAGIEVDYCKRDAGDRLRRRPLIMLPSRAQDYRSTYFRQVFEKAIRLLRDSRVIVVVGYSLPEEDALLRFILRQFAEEVEDAVGRFVIYVDPRSRIDSEKAVQNLFSYSGRLDLPQVAVYEGSFSSFVHNCLVLMNPK